MIGLRPDNQNDGLAERAAAGPVEEKTLRDAHVSNYVILLRDGAPFPNFEYLGEDFNADMAPIAADPEAPPLWQATDPHRQQPPPTAERDERQVDAGDSLAMDMGTAPRTAATRRPLRAGTDPC